jgi:hypothetical protein
MLIAEAHVETERSSRYLVQLCRHFNDEAQAHPEAQVHVEWSDDRGVASFGWGRCTLRADPGALTLRAEAPDEENLQRVRYRSPRAADPTRGRRRCRPAGVARGRDAVGVQAAGHDPVRGA